MATQNESALIAKMVKKFGPLTRDEKTIFKELLSTGKIASLGSEESTSEDQNKVSINGEKLGWLLQRIMANNSRNNKKVNLRIEGIFIDGDMPVRNVDHDKTIAFLNVDINGCFVVTNSEIRKFKLENCNVNSVSINRSQFRYFVLREIDLSSAIEVNNSQLESMIVEDVKSSSKNFTINIKYSFFEKNLRFRDVSGTKKIKIIKTKISESLEFKRCDAKVISINMTHARSFEFSGDFPKKLSFEKFIYEFVSGSFTESRESIISWTNCFKSKNKFYPHSYEQLANAFSSMGFEDESKLVRIQKYSHLENSKKNNLPKRYNSLQSFSSLAEFVLLWVYGKTTGYSYLPVRTAYCMAIIMLIGSIIFYCGFLAGGMTTSQVSLLSQESDGVLPGTPEWDHSDERRTIQLIPDDYPHFQSLIYSLDTFIPLVDLHQESYWMPNSNAPGLGFMLWLYLWCHIFAGWILTTLLLAGLTGIFGRDR